MDATAEQEIIQHTDDRTTKLHAEAQRNLAATGHPSTETVPAQEQPVLSRGIEFPDVDLVPAGVDEFIHGQEQITHVRTTEGRSWFDPIRQRIKRIKSFKSRR